MGSIVIEWPDDTSIMFAQTRFVLEYQHKHNIDNHIECLQTLDNKMQLARQSRVGNDD